MCYCPTPTLHLNLALTGDGAFLFSLKKTHSVWFISVLNYGDTENVLINHLLLVIPMSYPCYYTNLCPHKPHKHAHTHTHACARMHTHARMHRHTHTRTCTHTHTHTHTLTHAYTHTHTHTHTHILLSSYELSVCPKSGHLEPLLSKFTDEEEKQMKRMLQRMDVLAKVFHQILPNIINIKPQFISYTVDSGVQMMTEIR